MPLRCMVSPLARGSVSRQFHAARILRGANHYETLQLPTSASAADIKKSFYALSKTHHPDRNPQDPSASSRFVKISEAYNILGNQSSRDKYDRETLPQTRPTQARPSGSYSSANPAGGRAPTGLSKRRTQFRGPPPSFYRSGGWGTHSEKRSAAADETANNARANAGDHHNDAGPASGYSDAGSGQAGGMGPGQSPIWQDVPHFDREGHRITQENIQEVQDRRRKRRDREGRGHIELPPGLLATFLAVGGVISIGIFVPTLLFERFARRPRRD